MLSTVSSGWELLFTFDDDDPAEPADDLFDCSSYKSTDLPIVLPGNFGGLNMDAAFVGFRVFLEKYFSPLSF
jgi:hypothetical protein